MQTAVAEGRAPLQPIKVMVVDDSAVVRGLVSRWLEEDKELTMACRCANGELALSALQRCDPDVIVLDIEMPVMDGLTALPKLLTAKPGVKVLVASTLTRRNAEISFKALTLGAHDYVPKPDSNFGVTTSLEFRRELIDKIKGLGGGRERLRRRYRQEARRDGPAVARAELPAADARPVGEIRLEPFSMVPPRAIAIGSSTGGPQALNLLIQTMAPALARVPILIAQHMPPMFTSILADRLARCTGFPAKEAVDGEPLTRGTIYIAPGDWHMTVTGGDEPRLALDHDPPVNFCRPSVDPLFKSVAAKFGPATLGIVLTGMGQDGAAGVRAIAAAGGSIIAQDEGSSVVWGMPGAAADTGLCSAVLPPKRIAQAALSLLRGEKP